MRKIKEDAKDLTIEKLSVLLGMFCYFHELIFEKLFTKILILNTCIF